MHKIQVIKTFASEVSASLNKQGIKLGTVLLILITVVPFSQMSAAETSVQFAGFSYISDYQDIDQLFPLSNKANRGGAASRGAIDAELGNRLKSVSPSGYRLDVDVLAKPNADAIVTSLALTREVVLVEKIDENYKLLIQLSASALFVDFESMQILKEQPINVQFVDAKPEPYTDREIEQAVERLYFNPGKIDLLGQYIAALNGYSPKRNYSNTIRVGDVIVDDSVSEFLPEYLQAQGSLEAMLAQSIGKSLVEHHNVSLLPFKKGYAIGNKMSMRFADGKVFSLAIPEPDFELSIQLEAIKKVLFSDTAAGQTWVYGVLSSFEVIEPLSQKTYAKFSFKNGVTKVVPRSQRHWEDWPPFEESIRAGYSKLSLALVSPTKQFSKRHLGGGKEIDQLKSFMGVLDKCK
ncbi:hypothetical protein R0135_00655 [Congregibacter variabilis]|uniref:Uncharacterized protein n=1 Tax=Congregibacter variabilis TaxID=3081200 RepID=A0ABZ0I3T1_9GAMM|nr:hypothetical protein R0135_00655 [Congregibacter sp. IMCC43200]